MEKAHRITYRFDHSGNRVQANAREQEQAGKKLPYQEANQQFPQQEINQQQLYCPIEEQEFDMLQQNLTQELQHNMAQQQHFAEAQEQENEENIEQLELLIRNYNDDTQAEKKASEFKLLNDMDEFESSPKTTLNTAYYANQYEAMSTEREAKPQHSSIFSLIWVQRALSVISAIVSGCLIGYLFLTLVFGIQVWPLSAIFGSTEQTEAQSNIGSLTSSVKEQSKENPAADAGSVLPLSEQSFQYYVLQAGIFTKKDTRDEVIASLQKSGYVAEYTLDSNDRYVVYAGLATSNVDAENVQNKIKNNETYRKQYTISLPNAMPFLGDVSQLERYFADTNALITMYADLVSTQFEQASLSPIGKAAETSWKTRHEKWMTLSKENMSMWISKDQQQFASELESALQEANLQLQSYQAEPKAKYLWNVQRSLVKSVLIQKDWFEHVNTL